MRDEFKNSELWRNRGYLPHYEADGKFQFITYRLADSLPQKVLDNFPKGNSLTNEENILGAPLSSAAKECAIERRKYVESHLDRGWGSCLLKDLK